MEYFNQTYRIDVSWIGKVIYTYIYAIEFIEPVDKGHNEVQWGNIGEFQLFAVLTNLQLKFFNQIHRIDMSWIGKVIFTQTFAIIVKGQGH